MARKSGISFQGLFQNMPQGCALYEIVTDREDRPVDYVLIDINPANERMIGIERAKLLGRRATEIIGRPEPPRLELYGRVALTGEPASFEHYVSEPEERWYEVRVYRPAPRQFVTIITDVSDHKKFERASRESERAEAALRRSEEQLTASNRRIKQILASIQDDFYVLDRDWRFVFASRKFTSRIGKEPKDFVGNVIWEMFPRHLGTAYEENMRAAMDRGEVRRFEIEGKYTDSCYAMTVFPSPEGLTVLGTDITERKRALEALRNSEEMLHSVLDNSRDLIVRWNFQTGRYDYISPSVEAITGYPSDVYSSMDGRAALEEVHPDDRPALQAARKRSEDAAEAAVEYRQKKRDGEYAWISNRMSVVKDNDGRPLYRVSSLRDVTAQKKAEELIRDLAEQERMRLGAALEQSPDAVAMFDPDGTIGYVNAAFGSINKMAKNEVKGQSYFDRFAASSALSIRAAIAKGGSWQGQMSRRTSDGRVIELEVAASAITDPRGGIIGGLVTEKDITHEMVLQRQLRQSQKMEALGTLAGGIAHDFNNILNPIFISMELALLEPSLDPAVRGHLEVGLKAAERGRDLVKQVIAFSRQKERERKPVQAGPVVREAVNFLRVSLPSTIEVNADIRDEAGSVMGDPAQIHQIVMNLSSNAAYAMRQKGGVLTVGLDAVELVSAERPASVPGLRPGPYLRLTVSDTGTGIKPEVKEHLFDPFFTTKGPGEGSGMGLPVVDGIVRDYGGAIAVDTREGRGSTFTVYLPRIEREETPGAPVPDEVPQGSGRILLVDDEEAQVYSVRGMLEKLGYHVTARTKPQDALDLFLSDPAAFDLVITDQTMPHITGLQVAERILETRPETPIILCTGFSEAVDAKKAHDLGIREFLMKPYSIREMAEVIQRAMPAQP